MNLIVATAASLLLLCGAVRAEDTVANRTIRYEDVFAKSFQAADANGDGRLTPEEAKAGMPGLYRHFDEFDTDHKGYLNEEDILSELKSRVLEYMAGQGK